MRFIISAMFVLSFCTSVMGQRTTATKWYSQSNNKGLIIQNSFPKGGPYTGSPGKNHNYSFLIFFTRVFNETSSPIELRIHFPADSFAIPSSPDTFMKVFLPADTMTPGKEVLFNYGITGLEFFLDFNKPTTLRKVLNPEEEYFFYIGTVFYQTKSTARDQSKGGNRVELVLNDQELFLKMSPQIDSLACGHIILKK